MRSHRRRRPEGHVRQRSTGTYELRWRVDGRTVTTTTKVATQADAERELRRRLHAVDEGTHVDPSKMTVSQWLARWLDLVKTEIEPQTLERYRVVVGRHLVPGLGGELIVKLTPEIIQRTYAKWATTGRCDGGEGGLAASTRRNHHATLHAALGRAVELKLLARNPADFPRKRLAKVARREMKILTAEQARHLLREIEGERLYLPTLIAWATGMRRGEILALRWNAVELFSNSVPTLRVVQSLEQTKAGLRFKAPKNNKHRAITLPAFAVEVLRQHKLEQAKRLLLIGHRQAGTTLVCDRGDGEPLTPRALTAAFIRRIRKLKDIPTVRFHDLRHSHATELMRRGVPAKVVSERLGHASINITLDLYSHVDIAMQKDAATIFDTAFQGQK
jgi:integrase